MTLTTSGGSCGSTTDTKNITVNANPTASAGSGLSAICQGATSAAMGGSVGGGATGGTWSGGAGSWTNDTDVANATYTPGGSESGSITLTLTTSGGSCGSATDTKNINVDTLPGFANFQHASTLATCLGNDIITYGQIFVSGITPQGNGDLFNVDLGYSETNSDPSTWSNWVSASYNTTSGNNDEFTATLTNASHLTSADQYFLAYRYQRGACTVYGGSNSTGIWSSTSHNTTATIHGLPTASSSTSTGTVCEGSTISLTGGSSGVLEEDILIRGQGQVVTVHLIRVQR